MTNELNFVVAVTAKCKTNEDQKLKIVCFVFTHHNLSFVIAALIGPWPPFKFLPKCGRARRPDSHSPVSMFFGFVGDRCCTWYYGIMCAQPLVQNCRCFLKNSATNESFSEWKGLERRRTTLCANRINMISFASASNCLHLTRSVFEFKWVLISI